MCKVELKLSQSLSLINIENYSTELKKEMPINVVLGRCILYLLNEQIYMYIFLTTLYILYIMYILNTLYIVKRATL